MKDFFDQYLRDSLKAAGVDIKNPYYKSSEEYQKFKNEMVLNPFFGFMPVDEYIERFLLPEEAVRATYESIYDMGNRAEVPGESCSFEALSSEIIEQLGLNDEEAEDFSKRFVRSGGLIERLKKYLNFDLELFDSNEGYQPQVYKILYMFYMLENRDYPNTNILELLSKPSMENVDNSFVGQVTSNGKIINTVKRALEKELDLHVKQDIKMQVTRIIREWQMMIKTVCGMLEMLEDEEKRNHLGKTINMVQGYADRIRIPMEKLKYHHSPIETLYLKIVQYESRGRVQDIKKVNLLEVQNGDVTVPPEIKDKMKRLSSVSIKVENIEAFMNEEAAALAQFVYGREKTDKEMRRKIRDSSGKVKRLLSYFWNQTKLFYDTKGFIDELFLVSCLQAILLSKKNETFDYKFHGYEKKSTHKPQVHGALKKEALPYDALQIYWVRKVIEQWNDNLGKRNLRTEIKALEIAFDSLVLKILEYPNLDDMMEIHGYYIKTIKDILLKEEQDIFYTMFEGYLNEQGFCYIDEKREIQLIFTDSGNLSEQYGELELYLDEMFRQRKEQIPCTFEVFDEDTRKIFEYDFHFAVDYVEKTCTMTDFKKNYEPKYLQSLEEKGVAIIEGDLTG